MSTRRSSAKPVVESVVTGYCPTLGNAVRVTVYSDGTCRIERQPYTVTQPSRRDPSVTLSETYTYAVITESAHLHHRLISNLQQPAYWPKEQ